MIYDHLNVRFGDCNTTVHHMVLIIAICTDNTKGDPKTHINICKYYSFEFQQEMRK